VRTPLNLASRPVRNERLPATLFILATLLLLGVTFMHGMLVRRLMPYRSAALRLEVVKLGEEMEHLKVGAGHHNPGVVSVTQRIEWRVIKELVDRRTFWWSQLFEDIEKALTPDVRMVMSITPTIKDNAYWVEMMTRFESVDQGYTFMHVLELQPEFKNVLPVAIAEVVPHGFDFTYRMRYTESQSLGPASPTSHALKPEPAPPESASVPLAVSPAAAAVTPGSPR